MCQANRPICFTVFEQISLAVARFSSVAFMHFILLRTSLTKFGTHFHYKIMTLVVQDFCQCKIKSNCCFWSGAHRCTETCSACLSAIDCHNEITGAFSFIDRIDKRSTEKYFILNSDGVQIARTNTKKSIFCRMLVLVMFVSSSSGNQAL